MKSLILSFICLFVASGCASISYTKKSLQYDERAGKIRTITVMPIDFKVYQFSAGGVQEEMDEWANDAKKMIKDALASNLGGRNIQLAFVEDDTFKNGLREQWFAQKGLYKAVTSSALTHAYKGIDGFQDKYDQFDYTLGEEFNELSQVLNADAVLFVQGFDTQRTTGKVVMDAFIQALGGVYYTYYNSLNMGLVDPQTGDLLWFKTNNIIKDVDFRNVKDIGALVKWLTEDFLITE